MITIGVAGGIASGKSLVSKQFQSLGAHVLDADRVGHFVLTESEIKNRIRDRWGPDVFDKEENVQRKSLAAIVFANNDQARNELEELEKITHPRIRELLQTEIERVNEKGTHPAVILDAPVMFKSGWDRFCSNIAVELQRKPVGTRGNGRPVDQPLSREAARRIDDSAGGDVRCVHWQLAGNTRSR